MAVAKRNLEEIGESLETMEFIFTSVRGCKKPLIKNQASTYLVICRTGSNAEHSLFESLHRKDP